MPCGFSKPTSRPWKVILSSQETVDHRMFANFPTEDDVVKTWHGEREVPVATFACMAYMHAPFILDTLRGFVNQHTDFPFEIICYDDCSSDGTREIILAFAARYPTIVRTVFPEMNQRSAGIKPLFHIIAPLCRGRYIAFCEGDDFWSDSEKIQKQVDFLEQHPDYALTTHHIATIDRDGEMLNPDWLADFYKRDFSNQEVILAWNCVQIQSILFRNLIQDMPEEMRKTPTGDVFFSSLLGHFGKAKYLADIKPSMYRQHDGGVFSTLSLSDKNDQQSLNFYWLYRYYKRIGHEQEARIFKLRHLERGLREVPIIDLIRLIYLKLRPGRTMATLSIQRR